MKKTHQFPQRRQVIFWRLLASVFGLSEHSPNFENMAAELVEELDLPELILDPNIAVATLLQRYPELEAEFNDILLPASSGEGDDTEKLEKPEPEKPESEKSEPEKSEPEKTEKERLRQSLIFSKLLLNIFGPNTQTGVVSAGQYAQWTKDVEHFEKACGYAPGELRGKRGGSGTGGALVSEEQLRAGLTGMEGDLIERMALREVLQDNKLASKLTPSMALVEQLLRDKSNLSGTALNNAKRLIREYVDQLAEVLRLQVFQTPTGKIDYSVPPKRVFRNLDLKRTIWKNLTNWDPDEKRLYVDQLYYHHTARKKTPTRMIVVVDQSGSMVDAMVQCTILASIFAGLPDVDVHLFAFDTAVIDLTRWVHDPFEVLLRTNLGGGTYIYQALVEAAQRIAEPRNTALVLISDFYEGGSYQVLFDYIKSLKDSGVHFFPVGAVTSTGYFSVENWFRTRLKELGTPVLTGSPKKLIQELKKVIVI